MRENSQPIGDPRAVAVLSVWRANRLKPGTIQNYSQWVRAFLKDCARRECAPDAELTRNAVDRFAKSYARRHAVELASSRAGARSALRAWSWGLHGSGVPVSAWLPALPAVQLPRLLAAFTDYRKRLSGIAPSSLAREIDDLRVFLKFLRTRRRRPSQIRLIDVDAFVHKMRQRWSRRTTARACTSIRAFLRFLYGSGHHRHDLAPSVVAPRHRAWERPPRALPWEQVRRILRAVDRSTPVGLRDYAILLTMATYGLGSAEVRGLDLGDVDWAANRLRVRRPKTGTEVVLPLLPAVGRALASYLQNGRPRHATSRTVFIRMRAPYRALTASSAICHVLVKYAQAAHVSAPFLGSHVLRHSHATRQIELGAPQKVVGDILGHRSPSSTSVYVRVALRHLRTVALPVPR